MRKSLNLLLAIVIALGITLSSCIPKPVGTTPATSPMPTITVSPPPTSAPASTPIPTSTKVLNLAGYEPITLDPALSGEARSHFFITQIFSGLVKLDGRLNVVPDIAESWKVSDDGKTYTFTLRQNVKFQNGAKFTASDFKYSWERALNPATRSTTAVTYLGDILGAREVLSGASRELRGVRVISDYVLEVTIDAPKSYFLSKLTYPTAYVVEKASVEGGANWWRKPNGTGPFKLKEWQTQKTIVLERNTLYYGKVAGVASVNFQFYSGVPIDLYETGEVDAANVQGSYIYKASDKSGPFYQELRSQSELSFYYIGFNGKKPPFDDVNVRKAFAMAIDRGKIASIVFNGTVKPASGILPPGIPGYNEKLAGLALDPSKAKELIAQSKYGDVSKLPPITITTSGYGGLISHDLEAIIAEIKKNLGVEIKVRQLEPERFLYFLGEELDEMYEMGWIADYPHPQNFLDILFHSDADYNYGRYISPEVDRLLELAAVEKDMSQSLAMYQDIEQRLVSDAACIPLWFGQNYFLVKPYVKGYSVNPLGQATLNEVSLE